MTTQQNVSPAQELRAAASKIRESAEPIVTHRGADIGGVVEDWFKFTADYWEALDRHNTQTTAGREYPDEPDEVWESALVLARLINRAGA